MGEPRRGSAASCGRSSAGKALRTRTKESALTAAGALDTPPALSLALEGEAATGVAL